MYLLQCIYSYIASLRISTYQKNRKDLDFENLSHFLHYREEKSARSDFLHFLDFQHILNKNPIPACSVLDEDMGDGSDHFSILEDRTA